MKVQLCWSMWHIGGHDARGDCGKPFHQQDRVKCVPSAAHVQVSQKASVRSYRVTTALAHCHWGCALTVQALSLRGRNAMT